METASLAIKRVHAAVAAGFLLVTVGLVASAWGQGSAMKFVPPDVVTAGDIAYPPNTTATGMVSLVVGVDESGHAAQVQVLQDVPPLTAAAQAGVGQWAFQAAHANGK